MHGKVNDLEDLSWDWEDISTEPDVAFAVVELKEQLGLAIFCCQPMPGPSLFSIFFNALCKHVSGFSPSGKKLIPTTFGSASPTRLMQACQLVSSLPAAGLVGVEEVVLAVVVCARDDGSLVAMRGMNTEAPFAFHCMNPHKQPKQL